MWQCLNHKIKFVLRLVFRDVSPNMVAEYRSSHRRCSARKSVLRNFGKFTGKHPSQSFFFYKVAGLRPVTLLTNRLWHRCFPLKSVIFPRTHFYRTALGDCFQEYFQQIHGGKGQLSVSNENHEMGRWNLTCYKTEIKFIGDTWLLCNAIPRHKQNFYSRDSSFQNWASNGLFLPCYHYALYSILLFITKTVHVSRSSRPEVFCKKLQQRCFPVNFAIFFGNIFVCRVPLVTVSDINNAIVRSSDWYLK